MLAAEHAHETLEDVDYDAFALALRQRFASSVAGGKPVFATKINGRALFDLYLASLPEEIRQVHNCNTCRQFFERYGNLVVIDEQGVSRSAMWGRGADVPGAYAFAVDQLRDTVEGSEVDAVFLTEETRWGVATTGEWHHLHVVPPASMVHTRRDLTASQVVAEKREDFSMLCRALADYSIQQLELSVAIVASDTLERGEKVAGVARWLLALKLAMESTKDRRRRIAGIWLSVATAPAGWCHVRTTMIGTLLDDIAAGKHPEEIKANFREKMHPLKYLRPQAAPAAGNIAQAEKLIEKMGIATSLKRRMARLSDLKLEWAPRPAAQDSQRTGVFAAVKAKGAVDAAPLEVRSPNMTWAKFSRTLLSTATRIEVFAPSSGGYSGLLTAVDPDAPPILQWDHATNRNPVSSYTYTKPSMPQNWGIAAGWNDAIGICFYPHMRDGACMPNQSPGGMVLIKGARDLNLQGSGIFPESLHSELHQVRATIESYSNNTPVPTDPDGVAGLPIVGAKLRVHSPGCVTTLTIDRWD